MRYEGHSVNLMFMVPCIIVQFIEKNSARFNSVSEFIVPYLYEAQHVSGDTPPIIRSLKLHQQPLAFAYMEGCWMLDAADSVQ